jgi:DNA repair protein RadA/Sms
LVEEAATIQRRPSSSSSGNRPEPITGITSAAEARMLTGMGEMDRLLGGGLVPGMAVLVGGEPGIGKSTLMLQTAHRLASGGCRCLYVTGEESPRQMKLRAERLRTEHENLLVLAETNVEAITAHVEQAKPGLVIVDSIQTMRRDDVPGTPGTMSQVRECAAALVRLAKEMETPLFLVGHITKSGAIAGPKVLEHMVDCVLYFEGDHLHAYRILRAMKNRFGPTNEIAVFEMTSAGLSEVANPSAAFLPTEGKDISSGTAVVVAAEGTRALLVEIQALTAHTAYGSPARRVTGVDFNRVAMLLAVLDRRVGMRLDSADVFVNAVGGMRVDEPAVDLGIAVAVASSLRDQPLPTDAVFIAEVGLGGELRAVPSLEARLREAEKLGFKSAFVAHGNSGRAAQKGGMRLLRYRTLAEVIGAVIKQ